MSSTPDDKPQRATAAQLAARRIKDVRRRPRAGTPSGSAGGSFGSPFSSIDPNTVSSTSPAQQPMTNGFNFGQSQSFPPASPTPKPPAQNEGSQFAFGSGGGSSSFNFSASFGGSASTPVSNPFASMNTGGASQQPSASSFSGFKGNLFNVPSSGTQSPAQQPLPSGGLFGAGSQQSGSTGGLFGSTANNGPSSQSGIVNPANGSIFGQPTTGASTPNIFAQAGADKPNPFAQTAAFGDDSMQTSPDAKSSSQKPTLFGSGSGGFGVSTNFGNSGTGNLFGGSSSTPTQTPSEPLFGAKPTEKTGAAPPSLFGASTSTQFASSTPAAPSFSSAPLTTGTASSSLFGTSTPKPATTGQNPFQTTTSLFGASTPSTAQKPSEEKAKEETKANQSTPSRPSFNFSDTTTGASLFTNSASAAPAQSTGPSQPASTGSLFAPKPASSEQEKPKPAEGNPFNSLFVPQSAAAESPKPEQKPLPSSSGLFSPKPLSSEGGKTSELSKTLTPASHFSASTLGQSLSPAPQPPFSISAPQTTASAPAFAPTTTSQSPSKTNGIKPAVTSSPMSSTPSSPALSFDKLQPAKLPSGLDKGTKEEVEMAYRVRLLNTCFQREVAKLDATTNSFDQVMQFYLRVRETIGAPVEGAGIKRKAPEDSDDRNDSSQKARTFSNGKTASSAASPDNTIPSQLFSDSQNTSSTSNKRKATGDDDSDACSPAKRVNGDSATASIFANSFSRSKTSESGDPAGTSSPKKLDAPVFNPSTPEPNKSSLFSTTPTSSPPKPVFSTSSAPKDSSASGATPFQSTPALKPTFTASASGTPPANPFVIKPSSGASPSTTAPPLAVPKFGSGGPTNFLSQFKAQSDKNAEKEKEKRKAEEFDSDEDDEAEWERKDAEKQRRKREELEAQQNRRAKYVPGQGFSFENSATEEEKSNASAASSVLDSRPNSFSSTNNIFGHLSATPSENGEDEHDAADDTEEDSVSGDDAARESSFAPTEELEAGQTDYKANGTVKSPAPRSSDEGGSTEALKMSKPVDNSQQDTAKDGSSGGRSLFDRVEYDKNGKPKRQGEDGKTATSLFDSSLFPSSFNSSGSTPNPFAFSKQPQVEKSDESSTPKPASTNIFGSPTSAGNIFGGSTSAISGASTVSIFATGSSSAKTGSDNTWKPNTPIKFSSDTTQGSTSSANSESATAAPASGSSNHHTTLFGAPSAGAQPGSSGNQETAGFSFGDPSQSGSSLWTPSVLTSASQSRDSTPGVTSDTGAEDSTDGDAQKPEPQVDLARGGAGEEDEDVVIETRARALKMVDGSWASQGVGYLRILKNRTTSRSRVLVRADPSGNVVLNARLMKEIKYNVNGNNIQFLVPKAEGAPEMWALRLKAGEAPKIGTAMDEHKS